MICMMGGQGSRAAYWLAVVRLATLNMHFAPMICALILGLQLSTDSLGSEMPLNLEGLMFNTAILALAQALLAMISPLVFGADLQPPMQPTSQLGAALGRRETPDMGGDLVMKRGWGVFLMTGLRWIIMGVLMFFIIQLAHRLSVLPASPQGLGQLITILGYFYFGAYVLLWFAMTCGRRKFNSIEGEQRQLAALRFWHMCKNLVDVFCPLVAILRVSWWVIGLGGI